jgi:hypothetical protein
MRSKTVRFRQYTAYSEKKRNYAFLPNTRNEAVRFRQKRGIRENPIMYEDLTLNLTKFLKFWTSALSIIE